MLNGQIYTIRSWDMGLRMHSILLWPTKILQRNWSWSTHMSRNIIKKYTRPPKEIILYCLSRHCHYTKPEKQWRLSLALFYIHARIDRVEHDRYSLEYYEYEILKTHSQYKHAAPDWTTATTAILMKMPVILRQETHLPPTNRGTHLCKYNGAADFLKTCPSPYVLHGRSTLHTEPPKVASAGAPPLAVGAWLTA